MSYEGDECLIWPFNRNTHGYATVGVHGRRRIVSRMVCQMGRGEPPSPDHEAAHSCGHGAEGCVAKRHLSWKTHTANEHDKVEHGTVNRGTRNGGAKITEADARMVLTLSTDGLSQRKIAERFGISQGTVSKIVRGEKWGWIVTPEPSP
ncbi:MAG: helix-turn-helix domain-containing protein [Pseudolysinimonas sp.]